MEKMANYDTIEKIVKELSHLPEKQRSAIFKLNFKDLEGLSDEELRKRLSKGGFAAASVETL